MQLRVSPGRLARFAGYAALGPITGPLAAGLTRSLRAGHPVLAALYALAILEAWALLPLILVQLAKHV